MSKFPQHPFNLSLVHLSVVVALGCVGWMRGEAQQPSTNAPPAGAPTTLQAMRMFKEQLTQASDDADQGRLDIALREVDAALQINARSSAAYELRGSLYMQKKVWDLAERDYEKALEIDPTATAFKYKLGEIPFLQGFYDAARARFAPLQNDPRLGDLATYKVFLCDLLTGQEDLASKKLGQLNSGDKQPSYYYCNAVWDLFHHKSREAGNLINTASTIYSPTVNELYLSTLNTLNYLPGPVASFVTKDGSAYNQVKVFVVDTGLRVRSDKGWMTIPFEQLPDDLSSFPLDLQQQIATNRLARPDAVVTSEMLTFTTKDGKEYKQVNWSTDDNGLLVLTDEGRVTVPFAQLPNDLSNFPEELRERIEARRQIGAETPLLTFTTRAGTTYKQVKWSVEDGALRVLGPGGGATIPFAQLPDDLSTFPESLRQRVGDWKIETPGSNSEPPALTFTTIQGVVYDRAKWALDDDGLRVLTPDGWITVPFEQLPTDLSTFPASLRQQIADKKEAARKKIKPALPSP